MQQGQFTDHDELRRICIELHSVVLGQQQQSPAQNIIGPGRTGAKIGKVAHRTQNYVPSGQKVEYTG